MQIEKAFDMREPKVALCIRSERLGARKNTAGQGKGTRPNGPERCAVHTADAKAG